MDIFFRSGSEMRTPLVCDPTRAVDLIYRTEKRPEYRFIDEHGLSFDMRATLTV